MYSETYVEVLPVLYTLASKELEGTIVAIHGVLYYGQGCMNDRFVLIHKAGGFDGTVPIPRNACEPIDPSKCIMLDYPDLQDRMGSGTTTGAPWLWRCDAIVIGTLGFTNTIPYPARLYDLTFITFQKWDEFPERKRAEHEITASHFLKTVILGDMKKIPSYGSDYFS